MQKHRGRPSVLREGLQKVPQLGPETGPALSLGHGFQSALDKCQASPVTLNSVCLTGAEDQLQERVKKLGRT